LHHLFALFKVFVDSPVSVDQVSKRLNFNWQLYKVVPPESYLASDDLQAEVARGDAVRRDHQRGQGRLGQGLRWENRDQAQGAFSAQGHERKADETFIRGATVAPVASLIDEALRSLPKRVAIRGQHLMTLQGLVSTRKDSSLLVDHGQKVLNGQATSDVLSLGLKARIALGDDGEMDDLYDSELEDVSPPFDLSTPLDTDGQDLLDDLAPIVRVWRLFSKR
jgi:hypothetical protein